MGLIVSCTWLVVVAWLIGRAFAQRGSFHPVAAAEPVPDLAPRLCVIVPARDEEANVGRCLQALLAQTYPATQLRILLVDDHSTDRTPAICRALAITHPLLQILPSPPLPPHWVGKSHACWIGAAAAGDADWLCFMDADVWAERALLASALAAASAQQLDLLSLAPRHELVSFAERLVLPCGLYLLAFCQNLDTVQSARSAEATATGQFMLVRRSAYDAVGGHAANRAAICEDLELARLIKRAGGRVLLQDGSALLATRMYSGWRSLWIGISKNLVDMLGGPVPTGLTASAAILLAWAAWIIPAIDAARCTAGMPLACAALGAALPASVAVLVFHVVGAAHFRVPLWYGLLFPLGYSAGALIAADSIRRRLTGRVSWKGRTYP